MLPEFNMSGISKQAIDFLSFMGPGNTLFSKEVMWSKNLDQQENFQIQVIGDLSQEASKIAAKDIKPIAD